MDYRDTTADKIFRTLNNVVSKIGYRIVPDDARSDVYLHNYDSYEQYKQAQVHHNKRKLTNVWADATTLDRVAQRVRQARPTGPVLGLCHGARNGWEQKYFNMSHDGFAVVGTDISDTATDFADSVVWDFHDHNPAWSGRFDFVYSNSLDQAWRPRQALCEWFNQTSEQGLVIIEHTADHGPASASAMDPFGVRPQVFPYVVSEWFGHQVSIELSVGRKDNNDRDAWLFVMRKNCPLVV